MNINKTPSQLVLAIYLILVGINYFVGLRFLAVIPAALAIAAGVLILMKK